MAGDVVETMGERFKRLQAELSGGRSNPSARLAFATLVHGPAFAEYVLGLEQRLEHATQAIMLGEDETLKRMYVAESQLTAAQSERDEARREVERLRAALIGPQKQPASVRQIEAQAKSAANQLAEAVQAQSRDLTSKTPGAAGE